MCYKPTSEGRHLRWGRRFPAKAENRSPARQRHVALNAGLRRRTDRISRRSRLVDPADTGTIPSKIVTGRTEPLERRTFLSASSAAAALALTPRIAGAAAPAGDAALNATFQTIFEQNVQESPEQASSLGLDKGANAALKSRLDDRTAADRAEALARTKKAIAAVQAVPVTGLSRSGKLNREVVLYSLTQRTVGRVFRDPGFPQQHAHDRHRRRCRRLLCARRCVRDGARPG
jgi:hypothetical protein